jgi:diguanylate cyclase (GGDEF)-like protein
VLESLSYPREPEDPVAASYRQLAEIYHDLLSREGLDQVLERLVKTVRRLIPVTDILIAESDTELRVLRPLVAEGGWPDGFLSSTLPFGEGLIGLTAERGRAILSNDAHLDPRAGHVAGTSMGDPEAIVSLPLVARGVVIGAMSLYREGEGANFSEFEFELAQRFADAATLAIENARTREELRELSRRDELTGLYNRRGFNDVLVTALADGSRHAHSVALVVVDLDDFKSVNDGHGHPCGDDLLRQTATRLVGAARPSDFVCRIGGDEFALVLADATVADAEIVARRIEQALGFTPFRLATGDAVTQTASVGVAATGAGSSCEPEQLLLEADRGMYVAKRRLAEPAILKLVADVPA